MYYQKLLAAVHAGFTIIPNLDCDVFAIRVKREKPTTVRHETATNYQPSARLDDETEQRLPIGDGRYESPSQMVKTEKWDSTNEKNEKVHNTLVRAVDFAEMEFPLAIAHPLVMDATARAMAMKIFDRIGIVRDRTQVSGDPIAWYLDVRTL